MMEFPALWLNALCHISFRVKLTILSSTALKTLLRQLGTMFDFITHWLNWLERGWFATTVTIQTTTKDQNSNVKTILYDFVVREVGFLFSDIIEYIIQTFYMSDLAYIHCWFICMLKQMLVVLWILQTLRQSQSLRILNWLQVVLVAQSQSLVIQRLRTQTIRTQNQVRLEIRHIF